MVPKQRILRKTYCFIHLTCFRNLKPKKDKTILKTNEQWCGAVSFGLGRSPCWNV